MEHQQKEWRLQSFVIGTGEMREQKNPHFFFTPVFYMPMEVVGKKRNPSFFYDFSRVFSGVCVCAFLFRVRATISTCPVVR